ncbi:hypothetical protein AUR64_13650 [Haloprofundus marisrubri]|uniref:Uncharacterized protein n=1 Tax=Haloprofundus marisrubri TaxID=1514971 RepID=A0A0W1R5V4_9EURY|nr:hypothetical protein [Haloprofundus marisrubri]KTG08854.1 hypothetical protein AUR64_13650 [Haloprofundus marisrubri]
MSRNERTRRAGTSRRELLRGVGVGALGLTTIGASAAVGSAQTATVTAAISDGAPSFSDDADYTGLFVHLRGVSNDQSVSRLESCSFYGGDDEPIVYVARFIDRTTEDHPSEETLLYGIEGTDELGVGNLYVVNSQQSCDGPLIELELESVGASTINVSTSASDAESSPETDGGDAGGETAESTETTTPGFGPLAGAAGVGGAALWFSRRDDE